MKWRNPLEVAELVDDLTVQSVVAKKKSTWSNDAQPNTVNHIIFLDGASPVNQCRIRAGEQT